MEPQNKHKNIIFLSDLRDKHKNIVAPIKYKKSKPGIIISFFEILFDFLLSNLFSIIEESAEIFSLIKDFSEPFSISSLFSI